MAVQNDFSKGSLLSHMARIALPMTLAIAFANLVGGLACFAAMHVTVYRKLSLR